MKKARISIVMACRNDNYGGKFITRLQNFVNWTAKLAHYHQLSVENLIVEYNPDPQEPPLSKSLVWPEETPYFMPRIVQVPKAFHEQYLRDYDIKPVPLLEFVAKNIGIRRASGQYIITTNSDILFDTRLFRQLKKQSLKPNVVYRATRCDVPIPQTSELLYNTAMMSQMWLRKQAFRGYFNGGTYNTPYGVSAIKCAIVRFYHFVRKQYYLNDVGKMLLGYFPSQKEAEKLLFHYPFNASGDFIMAHRDTWHRLRAFREDAYISTHVDSLFLLKAIASGKLIKQFSCYVYHQDHARRYDPVGKNEEVRAMYRMLVAHMERYRKFRIYDMDNTEQWGLHGIALPEQF